MLCNNYFIDYVTKLILFDIKNCHLWAYVPLVITSCYKAIHPLLYVAAGAEPHAVYHLSVFMYEPTSHLMVRGNRPPWTSATPEELLMCYYPWYTRLKVPCASDCTGSLFTSAALLCYRNRRWVSNLSLHRQKPFHQ